MEIIEKRGKKPYKKPTIERIAMFNPRETIFSMGKK